MAGHHGQQSAGAPDPRAVEARHEVADISVRGLVIFGIFFVATMIVVFAVGYGVFRGFAAVDYDANKPASPLVDQRALPPEPRLQPSEGHDRVDWVDLKQMRQEETNILTQPAWIGPGKSRARIPIDRAMDLLLQKGLPTRGTSNSAAATPASTQPMAAAGGSQP